MTTPPVDTSREAMQWLEVRQKILRISDEDLANSPTLSRIKNLCIACDALRTALDAAQVREDELTEICCERNTEIASARLERDAEKARADRLAKLTAEQVIALVAGPYPWHHKMDAAGTRAANSFDQCRYLTIENIRKFFAIRALATKDSPT